MSRRTRLARAVPVAVLVAVGLLAGCGDDRPSAGELGHTLGRRLAESDDRGLQACALLDPAEIAEQFGEPVAPGLRTPEGCRFAVGEDQAEPGSGQLTLELPLRSSGVDAAVWFESLRPVAGTETVSGVADAAFLDPDAESLTAIVGDTVFTIRSSVLPEPVGLADRLRSLGIAVAERLDT